MHSAASRQGGFGGRFVIITLYPASFTISGEDFEATTHSIIHALTGSAVLTTPKPSLANLTSHLITHTNAASAAKDRIGRAFLPSSRWRVR